MRLTGVLLSLLLSSPALIPGQGIITTMAGTGFPGFSGDGGPATAALLYNPQNAAVDSSGTIYFSDWVNHRIRKITPDGIITTIAGNGIRGTAGDGGPALSASLGSVYQVAVDGAGHLCFGDADAYKIRCVTLATGIIQGYGTGNAVSAGDGGNVANASFYFPMGAAFDNAGNFYLSDFSANRVRRVDAVTGIITTIAGGPSSGLGDGGPATSASLNAPRGLQYWNGVLYIADEMNWRVRKVDLTTGIITTVAGNGSPYTSGDGGPATSAGMTPVWVTVDTSGNLFIVDTQEVRMVDAFGIITTVAGSSSTGWGYDDIPATQTVFSGLNGVAWDPVARRLLMSDYSGRIRQIFYTQPTATALSVSPNPAVSGQQVTLQATVSPAAATGSVRFHNGLGLLGSAPITNGVASFTWTPSGSSSYGLRAVYGGDPTYNLSGSDTITLTLKATTTTALASTPNPSLFGAPVTLTATVAPSAASGVVQFFNGSTLLGSATLSAGQAQLAVSNLPTGTDSLTAAYGGDANYGSSTSAALVQTVKASTTTSLTSSPNPSTFGSAVTLTATVTRATATGSVQFFNAGTLLGSANLINGQAQLTVTSLPAGTNSLAASYSGDAGNASSVSSSRLQTVNKANSTTTLSANPASQSNSGQTVTFTATIAPTAATGVVQFLDGSTLIGTATLSNGAAVFSTSSLANGSHSIKASYGGDSNVNGSQSAALSYKVKR